MRSHAQVSENGRDRQTITAWAWNGLKKAVLMVCDAGVSTFTPPFSTAVLTPIHLGWLRGTTTTTLVDGVIRETSGPDETFGDGDLFPVFAVG